VIGIPFCAASLLNLAFSILTWGRERGRSAGMSGPSVPLRAHSSMNALVESTSWLTMTALPGNKVPPALSCSIWKRPGDEAYIDLVSECPDDLWVTWCEVGEVAFWGCWGRCWGVGRDGALL